MIKHLARVALTVIIPALSACGSSNTAEKHNAVLPLVLDDSEPASYSLADPACQDQTATVNLTHAQIGAWNGDNVTDERVELVKTSTRASLVSEAVSATTYDDIYDRQCDLAKGLEHACDDAGGNEVDWSSNVTLKPLRVCQDDSHFPSTSYEGAALASIHYIETAYTRYKQLAPGKTDLASIRLSVLPQFIEYMDNVPLRDGRKVRVKTWITHNSAHFNAPPMIAIFPESAKDAATAKGFFWESQFVLGHEYGHHIAFTRDGMLQEQAGLRWLPFEHRLFDDAAFAVGASGDSARAAVEGAVGEAFADMTAYYAEGGTGASVSGLPCFGFNRDLKNKAFLNGDEKQLTEDRFDLLLGRSEEGRTDCGDPRYSDIHVVGAIFAHTLDQAFARLIASTPNFVPGSADDINQRYRLTISWMDQYSKAASKLSLNDTGDALLAPLATALASVTNDFLSAFSLRSDGTETAGGVKGDICKILKKGLPTLTDSGCI